MPRPNQRDTGYSIATLNNFIHNTGEYSCRKGNFEEVQKYLVKVQDIPQQLVHMEEAMAHMSGSVKDGWEQTKGALASATSAQENVQQMGSNIVLRLTKPVSLVPSMFFNPLVGRSSFPLRY